MTRAVCAEERSVRSSQRWLAASGQRGYDLCDLALLVAVPEEGASIRRRIRTHLLGSDGRVHGDWNGFAVRIQPSGVGVGPAEVAARRMLGAVRPRLVVCAGVAGALQPDLRRGELMVAESVVDAHGTETRPCDEGLVQRAVALGARRGVLMTTPRVVCSVAEKRLLSARASAVDMESLGVARVASECGVPFVALRVISDRACEALPIDINCFLDTAGNIRRGALATAVLARRGGLCFLLRMNAAVRNASIRLADFMEEWLPTICDP